MVGYACPLHPPSLGTSPSPPPRFPQVATPPSLSYNHCRLGPTVIRVTVLGTLSLDFSQPRADDINDSQNLPDLTR